MTDLEEGYGGVRKFNQMSGSFVEAEHNTGISS